MATNSRTKLKLLHVSDILSRETDEEHPLSANQLCERLEMRGISAERKSVYADIRTLQEYGMDIVESSGKKQGWFLASREFELAEVRLLVDAVQAADFITAKKTKELLDKLKTLISTYQASTMNRQIYTDHRLKHNNEKIYYNIDDLHSAIMQNCKVQFEYTNKRIDEKGHIASQTREHTVSPYAMIWSNDHYYLICNTEKYDTLMHLRLDRINRVRKLEEPARPIREVSSYLNYFDAADYIKKSFNMFSGEQQMIRLRCKNDLYEQVVDRFGEDIMLVPNDNGYFTITVKAMVSKGLIAWLLQFEEIEVISPESVRNLIRERIARLNDIYRD